MPTSSGLLRGVRWLKPTFPDYLFFPTFRDPDIQGDRAAEAYDITVRYSVY